MNTTLIKAAVCRRFGAPLQIEQLHLPAPSATQVQVQVNACAICHSDIMYLNGAWGGTPPLVLGHEIAGRVTIAGAESGFEVGTRVLVTLMRSCGSCITCRQRAPALCENTAALATPPLHDAQGNAVYAGLNVGGFAEQITVAASQVAALPDFVSDAEAALLACGVLTGWGAVKNTAALPAGMNVAVVGCGGVGLNCLQAAANTGADVLCAIDLHESKLQLAQQFGANHTLDPTAADAADTALRISNGRGFDYVFMAAGGAKVVEYAAGLLAPLGTLVLAGMQANEDIPQLNTTAIAHYQQRVLGSKMGGANLADDIPQLLHCYQEGRLKLKELIGESYALENINQALTVASSGSALKSIILPTAPATPLAAT